MVDKSRIRSILETLAAHETTPTLAELRYEARLGVWALGSACAKPGEAPVFAGRWRHERATQRAIGRYEQRIAQRVASNSDVDKWALAMAELYAKFAACVVGSGELEFWRAQDCVAVAAASPALRSLDGRSGAMSGLHVAELAHGLVETLLSDAPHDSDPVWRPGRVCKAKAQVEFVGIAAMAPRAVVRLGGYFEGVEDFLVEIASRAPSALAGDDGARPTEDELRSFRWPGPSTVASSEEAEASDRHSSIGVQLTPPGGDGDDGKAIGRAPTRLESALDRLPTGFALTETERAVLELLCNAGRGTGKNSKDLVFELKKEYGIDVREDSVRQSLIPSLRRNGQVIRHLGGKRGYVFVDE
ncbi:hypothetical protein Pla163_11150 [Planctomycetes bacterium Pla163]|uniref:Uncharacterized protein n=1 Tax=Rohdeia mirabilis TaxID=2528008 RepID=A0A518CXR3_9BACT|nr:hypothetical protein Pla163_11150 [Planctomycetes bacterium Pla163]